MNIEKWLEPGLVTEAMLQRAKATEASHNIPTSVALLSQAFKQKHRPNLLANLADNPSLCCLLEQHIANSRLQKINAIDEVTFVTTDLTAGDNGSFSHLYGIWDVRFAAFIKSRREGIPLDDRFSGKLFAPLHTIDQSFGDIAIAICLDETRTKCLLITNGQAHGFWRLSRKMRADCKRWYEEAVRYAAVLAKNHAGVERVLLPSNALVQRTLADNYGQYAPDSVLDTFYDKFAGNRNATDVSATLTHPVTRYSVSGDMHELPESF